MFRYTAEQRFSHTEAIILLFWRLWRTYTRLIQRVGCWVSQRCINQPLLPFTYFVKARALQRRRRWGGRAQLIAHNCRGADGERRDRNEGSTSNWNAGWQFQQLPSVRQPAEVFLPRPSIIAELLGVDSQTKPIVPVTIDLALNYNGCTDASNRRWKFRESGIRHLWMFCQTLVTSASFQPVSVDEIVFCWLICSNLMKRPGIAHVPTVAGKSFVPTEALNSRLPTEFPTFSASYATSRCQPQSFHHFLWPTFTRPFPLTFHIFSGWLLHIRSFYHPPLNRSKPLTHTGSESLLTHTYLLPVPAPDLHHPSVSRLHRTAYSISVSSEEAVPFLK